MGLLTVGLRSPSPCRLRAWFSGFQAGPEGARPAPDQPGRRSKAPATQLFCSGFAGRTRPPRWPGARFTPSSGSEANLSPAHPQTHPGSGSTKYRGTARPQQDVTWLATTQHNPAEPYFPQSSPLPHPGLPRSVDGHQSLGTNGRILGASCSPREHPSRQV